MAKQNKNITFTPRLVDKVGRISDVLAEFLEEQVARIQNEVKGLADQAVQQLLAQFVTEEGTKKPIARAAIEGELTKQQLDAILSRLEDARILKQDEPSVYELAHDTLAQRIIDALDAEELEIRRAVRIVRDRYTVFEDTETYLEPREVQLVEVHEKALKERLSAEEWAYLIRSRSYNKKQRRKWAAVAIGTIIILSFLSIFSFVSKKNADAEKENALNNLRLALNAQAILEFDLKGDATKGFLFARAASDTEAFGNNPESDEILRKIIFQGLQQERKLFYNEMDSTEMAELPGNQEPPLRWTAVSPDGKAKAEGSQDSIVVQDSEGKVIRIFVDTTFSMHRGWFSPDGRHILIHAFREPEERFSPRIWIDAIKNKDGYIVKELGELSQGRTPVKKVAFSEDGESILVLFKNDDDSIPQSVGLYKIPELEPIDDNLPRSKDFTHFFDISPGGGAILMVSDSIIPSSNTTLVWKIWQANDGKISPQGVLWQGGHIPAWAGFSPNGKYILAALDNNTPVLLDWQNKEKPVKTTFTRHTGPVRWATFSPGGDSLLTASEDGTALLWNLDGRVLSKLYHGPKDSVTVDSAGFTPDGNEILTCSADSIFRIWFGAQPKIKVVADIGEPISSSILEGKNNHSLLAVSESGNVRVGNISKTEEKYTMTVKDSMSADGKEVKQAILSPKDSSCYLLTFHNNSVAILKIGKKSFPLDKHTRPINHAAFSPSGDTILTASDDWNIRLWNANDGSELSVLEQKWYFKTGQFSHDGRTILTVAQRVIGEKKLSKEKPVELAAAEPRQLNLEEAINFATFFPRKKTILTAVSDNTLRLWELGEKGWKCVDTLTAHTRSVNGVSFPPSGDGFLSFSEDGTVICWDDKRNIRQLLTGHKAPAVAAEFSPDGNMILTLSSDGVLNLWSENGELIYTHKHAHSKINSAHFMQRNNEKLSILVACDDGQVKRIPLSLDTLIEQLDSQLDELSKEEKEKWGLLSEEDEGQE